MNTPEKQQLELKNMGPDMKESVIETLQAIEGGLAYAAGTIRAFNLPEGHTLNDMIASVKRTREMLENSRG